MISIVVVTHGEFGAYLIEAAETIVGAQEEALRNVSVSPRTSLDKARELVEEAARDCANPEGLVFLVDMPGGTPMNVVFPVAAGIEKSAVICGVNINMMISAFAYRGSLPFAGLTAKIMEDGRKAICDVKSLLAARKGGA
ncbi:MAG: PTS system mannose-specific IIA component [Elusimicrobia bacterium]|nr:MAG: PTS system mannose-specific IIA component [Elusimicrobiota bacterium]KAF0157669.1 MAG: PTS system mannose-specific IIA component [Elusimicrobiota bacterium]